MSTAQIIERNQRYLFLGFFLLGSLIAALGQYGLNSVVVTVGGPVGAMLAYLLLTWLGAPQLRTSSQFSDSIYYLGFLYTLIALAMSLLSYALGSESENMDSLIRNFGLALITTILGLALRVTLRNFWSSETEELGRSEQALVLASQRLRSQIDQVAQDFVVLNKTVKESLVYATQETTKTLRSATSVAGEEILRMSRQFGDDVTTTLEEFDQDLKFISGALVSTNKKHEETIEAVISSFQERIRDLELPRDALTRQLSEPLDELKGLLQEVSQTLDTGIQTMLANLETRVEEIEVPPDIITREISRPLEEIGQLMLSLSARVGSLTRRQTSVDQKLQEFEQVVERFSTTMEAAVDPIERLSGISKTTAVLETGISDFLERISDISQGLSVQKSAIETLANDLTGDLETIRQLKTKLRTEVGDGLGDITELRESLVDSARFIRLSLAPEEEPNA